MSESRKSPPQIFSKARRAARRSRMAGLQSRGDAPRYVLDDMVEDVLDRLSFMRPDPGAALIVGDWSGRLAEQLSEQGWAVEIRDPALGQQLLDEEMPYPVASQNLIVSLGTLDTINDLPGALLHLRNALAPDGLIIAQIIGAGSLSKLRAAMLTGDGERVFPRMHPLVDNRAGTALLERAGFARQVVDSRSLNVRFPNLQTLVGDLRAQGLGSVLAQAAPPLTKARFAAASESFANAADDDGKTTEPFEILTLTGWR